ncbi:hypothetical protein WJX77_006201 [Trebouxia sp. C0004]
MATQSSPALVVSSPESTPGHTRAYVVPPIAVLVDVGLPLVLLAVFAVTFRMRRAAASKQHTVDTTDEATHIAPFTTVELPSGDAADPVLEVLSAPRPFYWWLLDFNIAQKMRSKSIIATNRAAQAEKELLVVASLPVQELLVRLGVMSSGPNKIGVGKPQSLLSLTASALLQPFNFLMVVVAVVTISPPNSDWKTFTMVMVSSGLAETDFFIEYGSPSRTAALTGEATPVHKTANPSTASQDLLEQQNLCFAGTHVVSGDGLGVVLRIGNDTYIAGIAAALAAQGQMNAFDFAVRRIVYVFIAFVVVMVPLVIVLNGLTTRDWHGAVTFGLSVAVALTPQMLPMIVTANLVQGVRQLRKQKAVVKRLDAVQNLGAMDVLCTDKTGTLTNEQTTLVLEGNQDYTSHNVLKLAYANSYFQSGLPNSTDLGLLAYGRKHGFAGEVEANWAAVDELPFDFERRRLSVVLLDLAGGSTERTLVCKGAVEEVLAVSTYIMEGNAVQPLDEIHIKNVQEAANAMTCKGLRVMGVATRLLGSTHSTVTTGDECLMIFQGFLTFRDEVKASAGPALRSLMENGVAVKVLTGDTLLGAKQVWHTIGMPNTDGIEGHSLAAMEADQFLATVRRCSIFAKVTPQQKVQIVTILQQNDHVVGFLGDGTNDALALRKADVGVSVDSGTDVAKDAADVVLLEKDLKILETGMVTGRIIYGNTIKYIKFSASSSFGNTFSILAAAVWLPFTPIAPIQVLLLNLLYNISQVAIPWDTMDPEFLKQPKKWSAKFLGVYMLIVGPISSIFDICTFCLLWYFYHADNAGNAAAAVFQTGWFLESLMTQTFIVHLLRTERWPFLHSRAAWPLILSSFGTMVLGIVIPYIPGLGPAFQLIHIKPSFYGFMAAIVLGYCLSMQALKYVYIKVFGTWL